MQDELVEKKRVDSAMELPPCLSIDELPGPKHNSCFFFTITSAGKMHGKRRRHCRNDSAASLLSAVAVSVI